MEIIGNEPPSPSLTAKIPLSTLQEHYDAVILTYGAAEDRALNISGENQLKNIFSARDFVNWYNGHPYHSATLSAILDLSKVEHVTVVGQGNVAMDVGRILLKSVDELRKTDIPEYALAELAKSKVKRVDIVGRRGPLQLACTTKELREMMALDDVGFEMDLSLLASAEKDLVDHPEMHQARMKKRALGLLRTGSKSIGTTSKSWSFQFLQSPTAFLPSSAIDGSASSSENVGFVEYDINSLISETDPGLAKAQSTGDKITRQTDMVLKSVGYRSIGLAGVPFDERKSVVKNVDGRVTTQDGSFVSRFFDPCND